MKLFSWFRKSTNTLPTGKLTEEKSIRRDLVVPMISGQAWIDSNRETFSKIPDFSDDCWPFAIQHANGLYITYAVDSEQGWRFISISEVDDFGGPDRLQVEALQNLQTRGDIQIDNYNGRFRLTVPDELDLSVSVILQPERWRPAICISDDLVVAIPTRIEVLICAATDKAAISELDGVAKNCFEAAEAKPVSPHLYILSGGVLSRISNPVDM